MEYLISDSFPWNYPYCNHDSTIIDKNYSISKHKFNHDNSEGDLVVVSIVTTCPNPKCREFSLKAFVSRADWNAGTWNPKGKPLHSWNLKPQSKAKPYPEYVPEVIRKDYEEACMIQDSSPKASATLSRRCLQGMIRNFWKIRKRRLIDEINAIKNKVDPLTWKAIDAVRQVGNISAHMEKDINLIIDVDPKEAEMLIGLIETLMKDWYIAKYEREQQFSNIVEMAANKKIKKSSKSSESSVDEEKIVENG